MTDFDVIVVGAGPAGSCAAYECARAGMKTLLLEKQKLPRHKTCGGGVPVSFGAIAEFTEEGVIESDVQFMRHTFQWSDPVLAPINPDGTEKPLSIWMVQRSIFDNALTQRAASAGAQVWDEASVTKVHEGDGSATVRLTMRGDGVERTVTSRWLIGCDGANGVVARQVGLRPKRPLAIGMELELPHRWGDGHESLRPEVMHLEFGAVKTGYAWVFPKGDHLNIGAGFFRPKAERKAGDSGAGEVLRTTILDYLKLLGVNPPPEQAAYHAHPLPIWGGKETLHSKSGAILLCGDAAGLINPFFGDGILFAARSGTMAGQCIVAGQGDQYTKRIHESMAPHLDAAEKISKLFYQFPGICYQIGVKRPGATHAATRLLCGDLDFGDVSGRVMRRIRSALSPIKRD